MSIIGNVWHDCILLCENGRCDSAAHTKFLFFKPKCKDVWSCDTKDRINFHSMRERVQARDRERVNSQVRTSESNWSLYNVGDKVRLKTLDVCPTNDTPYFITSHMEPLFDGITIYTISEIIPNRNAVRLEGKHLGWGFPFEWLEDVETPKPKLVVSNRHFDDAPDLFEV